MAVEELSPDHILPDFLRDLITKTSRFAPGDPKDGDNRGEGNRASKKKKKKKKKEKEEKEKEEKEDMSDDDIVEL